MWQTHGINEWRTEWQPKFQILAHTQASKDNEQCTSAVCVYEKERERQTETEIMQKETEKKGERERDEWVCTCTCMVVWWWG